jgi:hypothetical protein
MLGISWNDSFPMVRMFLKPLQYNLSCKLSIFPSRESASAGSTHGQAFANEILVAQISLPNPSLGLWCVFEIDLLDPWPSHTRTWPAQPLDLGLARRWFLWTAVAITLMIHFTLIHGHALIHDNRPLSTTPYQRSAPPLTKSNWFQIALWYYYSLTLL